MNTTALIELVDKLNAAAYKQTEGATTLQPFTYMASNGEDYIAFLDHVVWSSVEDTLCDDIKHEISSFLEAVARLDVPALVALLPEPMETSECEQHSPPVTAGEEELVTKCIEVIRAEGKATVSLFQRRLTLGYTQAARICDILEHRGIIGPAAGGAGTGPREIINLPLTHF